MGQQMESEEKGSESNVNKKESKTKDINNQNCKKMIGKIKKRQKSES